MKHTNSASQASPVYSTLISTLSRQIEDGQYVDGDRIPTESALTKQFGISIRSVRKGIDELVARGVLERLHGSGTYVRNGQLRQKRQVYSPRIAIVFPLMIRGYHPFYSEMLRGIREGVNELEKEVYEYHFKTEGNQFIHSDIAAIRWDKEECLNELNSLEAINGVICGASIAHDIINGLHNEVSIVTVDAVEGIPYVMYDLRLELEKAVIRQAIEGARNIWVYGGPDDWKPFALPDDIKIEHTPSLADHSGLISDHIRKAYEAGIKKFRDLGGIDGIIVGSDFEAQGIMDAAVTCKLSVPDDIKFTCIVNRESRLTYPFPLTVQVCDGYLKGQRLVSLLKQHMQSPLISPDRIILHCEEERHA